MYILLSPSKSLDFSRDFSCMPQEHHVPLFSTQTKKLHKVMKAMDVVQIAALMHISTKLAQLNYTRFQKWNGSYVSLTRNTEMQRNFAPALSAFTGDVYRGFDISNYTTSDWSYADQHIGILSGFYGILSPLTLMKPYRLEMGTSIHCTIDGVTYNNLYAFWRPLLTQYVDEKLQKEKILLNLASQEYAKAIDFTALCGRVITVDFKVNRGDGYSIIAIFAKYARGEMANLVIKNRIKEVDDLKNLVPYGFRYNKELSEGDHFVFTKNVINL